jgi:hypothetical protein
VGNDHSTAAAQDGTLDRTQIVLRAYPSPLPLGLFAFAVGNVLLAVGGTESRSAMVGGLATQAGHLPQEAGVRAQL